MSRTTGVVICSMVAVLALTACGGSTKTVTSVATVTRTVTVPVTTSGNVGVSNCPGGEAVCNSINVVGSTLTGAAARRHFDGKNPTAECGYTGIPNGPYVHTSSEAHVRYFDGQLMGVLKLRQSDVCPVAAAELFFQQLRPGTRIYLRLVRNGTHHRSVFYQTTSRLSPAYTAMLTDDHASGCVFAEAWIQEQGSFIPIPVTTSCLGK